MNTILNIFYNLANLRENAINNPINNFDLNQGFSNNTKKKPLIKSFKLELFLVIIFLAVFAFFDYSILKYLKTTPLKYYIYFRLIIQIIKIINIDTLLFSKKMNISEASALEKITRNLREN